MAGVNGSILPVTLFCSFTRYDHGRETEERVLRVSVSFLFTAYVSTIVSMKIPIKNTDRTKCGWKCWETGNFIRCWWEYKRVPPPFKVFGQFLINVNIRFQQPSNPTQDRGNHMLTNSETHILIRALFIITNSRKQLKYLFTM